jgi:formylglycine-generating enzyme required for sulfatase activity
MIVEFGEYSEDKTNNNGEKKMKTTVLMILILAASLISGCGSNETASEGGAESTAKPNPSAVGSQPAPAAEVEKKEGMVFIPEGKFIAGTPPGTVPRCPNEEMQGTEVALQGFYIDEYPSTGPGQPPKTEVTWEQAKQACESGGKRLCTEMEWERACKGNDNSVFPYGAIWDMNKCGAKQKTGKQPALGSLPGCVTEEGVHDMNGFAWEWTNDDWGIAGADQGSKVLRGGHKRYGKLANRCANRTKKPADTVSERIGYRCCAGDTNSAMVRVTLAQGARFEKASMPVDEWKALKTDTANLDIIDDYRGVRRLEQHKDPASVFSRAKSSYPFSRLAGDSILWRPAPNSNIYVMNAVYKMHRGLGKDSNGTLLIFAEKDPSGVMRFLAMFDRPDSGGESPLFYTNPRENGDLDIILTWQTPNGPTALVAKAKYNCGGIRIKPDKWLIVNDAALAVPTTVPNLKPVYTPGEGV